MQAHIFKNEVQTIAAGNFCLGGGNINPYKVNRNGNMLVQSDRADFAEDALYVKKFRWSSCEE